MNISNVADRNGESLDEGGEMFSIALASIDDLTSRCDERPPPKCSDEQTIAQFGKRQQFRRNFNLLSTVALSCTITGAWAGMFASQHALLFNGGPTALMITIPIVFVGVLMQALVVAELSSMIPLSGGQYNWVAILSPPRAANFLSYVTGWMLTIAWHSGTAGVVFMASKLIVALANAMHPSYEIRDWHATLIFFAIVAIGVFVTTYLGKVFPMIESLAFLLYVLGFFTFIIVMAYLSPKVSPSMVFNNFLNGGGWKTNIESTFLSMVPIMYGFVGFDASVHIAEEVENAARVVPRAVVLSVVIIFVVGCSITVLALFCFPAEAVLTSNYSFPVIDMFMQMTHSDAGTSALTALIITMLIFGSIGILATGSRMLWAFASGGGVPGSRYISKVEPQTGLPLYSIGVSAAVSLLFGLIGLGSSTALHVLEGLSVACFYSAFCISALAMLWRRLTIPTARLPWGPFRLGYFGIPVTILALLYSVIGIIFSFWPPVADIDASSFNWSVVVFCGVLILSMAWWLVRARKTFIDPKVEIDLHQ